MKGGVSWWVWIDKGRSRLGWGWGERLLAEQTSDYAGDNEGPWLSDSLTNPAPGGCYFTVSNQYMFSLVI